MYKPSEECIDFFIWRKTYFVDDNVTPVFHYQMATHFLEATPEDNTRVVKAFRGSAKSSTVCYLAIHRAENVDAHFTMIISATATLAEGLIADIRNMILSSNLPYKLIRAVSNEIQLRYKGRDYYILGVGSGAALRGTKRGGKRADLIITDDLMTMEVSANKVRSERLTRWYYSDLRPSLDPNVGVLWSVGTPMTYGDIFDTLATNNPTLSIPLDEYVWTDRFSKSYIDKLKEEYKAVGMLREYKREFELIYTDAESRLFDMSKVHTVDKMPRGIDCYLTCDLAISEKSSADYSALTVIGVDEDGIWYVYPVQGRWKPSETASQIFKLVNQFSILEVAIEQGMTYLAVREHIDQLMLDYQNYFNVSELKHGGNSKISRIKSLEPIVNANRFRIVDNGRDAESLVEQMELVDMTSIMSQHDDLIDSVAYACQLVPNTYTSSLPSVGVSGKYY